MRTCFLLRQMHSFITYSYILSHFLSFYSFPSLSLNHLQTRDPLDEMRINSILEANSPLGSNARPLPHCIYIHFITSKRKSQRQARLPRSMCVLLMVVWKVGGVPLCRKPTDVRKRVWGKEYIFCAVSTACVTASPTHPVNSGLNLLFGHSHVFKLLFFWLITHRWDYKLSCCVCSPQN